jgi:DNA repair protein RecN (Recombination protein N)
MLHELRIENLLLIERAELRFGAGLNAITGETGAGKTVLAHSLDLLMGGKARPHVVRPGASEAYVEGVFAVPDGFFDDPDLADIAERLPENRDEIVIARRVGASGRTSAFVAGRSANLADLRALGSRLVAFYGQHEHRKLTLSSAQMDILDGFAGPEHLRRREGYRAAHSEVLAIERELGELRSREGTRERDLDLMRFELTEIDELEPDPEELERLAGERARLRGAEGLRGAAAAALAALSAPDGEGEGAVELVAAAGSALAGPAGVDPALDEMGERAEALSLELAELGSELRSYGEQLEADPARLEEIEERLAVYERLTRKHGGTLEGVIAHAESCRERIALLENAAEAAEEAERRLAAAREHRSGLAAALSATRAEAAPKLERAVAKELGGLAMDGARLEVALEPIEPAAAGAESVELRVSTNRGLPISPLRDAASGGELSRIMLALAGLGSGDPGSTMVFDEIDAGVGGTTARAVGERLRELGERRQVICITHLAQVASGAGTHFTIAKSGSGDSTLAAVERVEGERLLGEIVRMLGGEEGDETVSAHARELLAA